MIVFLLNHDSIVCFCNLSKYNKHTDNEHSKFFEIMILITRSRCLLICTIFANGKQRENHVFYISMWGNLVTDQETKLESVWKWIQNVDFLLWRSHTDEAHTKTWIISRNVGMLRTTNVASYQCPFWQEIKAGWDSSRNSCGAKE